MLFNSKKIQKRIKLMPNETNKRNRNRRKSNKYH